ncbi:SGNH/GDSL hydrolase family protein [Pseudochrobactrum asaccharolyticum]|uniref:GDSL-like lipase/acylhydrolase family protein n=1 Tax=Pseudochrobactrum asaccharolyticum TaxID=354351 RepID=A0A366DLL0_9HYPH|nr:SGNH/GDSL hydrolase family protein [Pseudochrobactrum asaccharolyticum]RBO90936.1 GDSL-like lipase/acylhydrolase family protein [Pseudochrobactrum asaccharolyticum]
MLTNNLIISTPIDTSLMRGFVELEKTTVGLLPHRLPVNARTQFSDPQLALIETETSGVRLEFKTSATTIEIDVLPTRREIVGIRPRPNGVYDLCINGRLERQQSAKSATILLTDMSAGTTVRKDGPLQTLRFDGLPSGKKLIEIWLPHNEITELCALRANAPIEPLPNTEKSVWVHHGSSISHGSNAKSPTEIWPIIAARATGMDLMNMGFSGNALLDPFTARAIRDRRADFISVKIGINLVNMDLMRLRAFGPAVHGFLDTIRDGHPDTPLLMISPIYCPIHETTPGPGMFDLKALAEGQTKFLASGNSEEVQTGKLTLTVIRQHLQRIVEERSSHDPNIHYLDGLMLYGEQDHARLPLEDRLHPDAEVHRLIGQRFAPLLQSRCRL